MPFSPRDVEVVRSLGRQVAEIAALSVQQEKRNLWKKLVGLKPLRPLVWINEIPWPELEEVEDELRLQSENDFARNIEKQLRTTLYEWKYLRTDGMIDGTFYSPLAIRDTGLGAKPKIRRSDGGSAGAGAEDFEPILKTDEDLEMFQTPRVSHDTEETERTFRKTTELLGDALPVKKRGIVHRWFAPWDFLIRYWGIAELFTDMYDRPEFVNRGISRIMDLFLNRLEQWEQQKLLSLGDNAHRVGSGGYGLTDELPSPGFDGKQVRALDQWGTSTGQIFSEVSPDMHWEFCLRHEMRWLERFGLNCYGCCEPLHHKMDYVRRIPRLRRISVSTWADIEKAAAEIKRDYIFSFKPNPAVFAWDQWNPAAAEKDLRRVLERTRGCALELIMKDVSTCRRDPRRLHAWCALASNIAEEYAE